MSDDGAASHDDDAAAADDDGRAATGADDGATAADGGTAASGTADLAERARELGLALARSDHEAVQRCLAPDATVHVRRAEIGREEFVEEIVRDGPSVEGDLLDHEILETVVGDGAVAVFFRSEFGYEGTFARAGTEDTYETTSAVSARFEDGRVTELRGVENRERMLAALGFLSGEMSGGSLEDDLTDDRIRLEYEDVLMRILRHNVRNRATVALGMARRLAENRPDTPARERLEAAIEDLTDVSEKVHTVRRELLDREFAPEPVVLEDHLREVLEEEAGPAAWTVEGAADGPLTVETDPVALTAAVEEAVENAVDHAGGPGARIEAGVDAVAPPGFDATVTVADDGPGVPEHELEPVEAGTETDLTHASSVGLWRIKWSVERLGGEVSFETADGAGTTVRIHLPDLGTRRP